jgi:hypothetical protein
LDLGLTFLALALPRRDPESLSESDDDREDEAEAGEEYSSSLEDSISDEDGEIEGDAEAEESFRRDVEAFFAALPPESSSSELRAPREESEYIALYVD